MIHVRCVNYARMGVSLDWIIILNYFCLALIIMCQCTNCSTETSLTAHQCVFLNANKPLVSSNIRVIKLEEKSSGRHDETSILTKIKRVD